MLALKKIANDIHDFNVCKELVTRFTSKYEAVRKVELEYFKSDFVSENSLKTIFVSLNVSYMFSRKYENKTLSKKWFDKGSIIDQQKDTQMFGRQLLKLCNV
jgi:hypothetical protein